MSWWEWLLIVLGVFAVLWAGFVALLFASGHRDDARALAGFIPDCIVLVHRLLHDPRVPRRRKLLLVALIAYLALPFDLVPDFNHDTMMHTENSELLADRLPNSHLRIYPDANHGFLNQYPELFGDHVGAFLSAL